MARLKVGARVKLKNRFTILGGPRPVYLSAGTILAVEAVRGKKFSAKVNGKTIEVDTKVVEPA